MFVFKNITKKDISILFGNTFDHFDTSLYGFLAPIMAPKFFPNHDPVVGLILAYSILTTSLITRPIGVFIFAKIASLQCPSIALSYSLIGIAISTFLIGCIPDYFYIGSLAPLILILLRAIGGVMSAGEHAIAGLYILENKPIKEAMKLSSLYQSSTVLGIILASAASTLIIMVDLQEAWRIPYWLGGITAFFAYKIRKQQNTASIKVVHIPSIFATFRAIMPIWQNKFNILKIAAITSFTQLTYYIPFVVMNSFIPLVADISFESMMALNTLLLIFDMLLIPTIQTLLKNIDPYKVIFKSSLILAITIIPLWNFIEKAPFWYVTFVRFWIVCCGVAFLCAQNIFLKKAFEHKDQYLLIGMGGALSAATVGKFTPSLCLLLWHYTGSAASISIYIAALSMVTLITIIHR